MLIKHSQEAGSNKALDLVRKENRSTPQLKFSHSNILIVI